jgi:hypothetical protein
MKSFILLISLLVMSYAGASTGEIQLADGHRIRYDKNAWEYVLSENTFKKTVGLLEARHDEDIRGIIDTEVRFVSAKEAGNHAQYLANQCSELKNYWDSTQYDVLLHDQMFCIIRTKNPGDGLSLYQVIQAKVSQSRADMLFVYTWTFHTKPEKFNDLAKLVENLRRQQ